MYIAVCCTHLVVVETCVACVVNRLSVWFCLLYLSCSVTSYEKTSTLDKLWMEPCLGIHMSSWKQAVLNNLENYNKICTKSSEHNAWMHCSNRVWLTMVKIPTSRHNIAVFLLLWKLIVNCRQLVLIGEVQQKVDWMWLANILVVFGRPAVKRNTECARDNVLLLCAHVMQCPITVCRQYNIYAPFTLW